MPGLELKPLTLANFSDYETLTRHGDDGQNCYCSFWHAKWPSMDEYHQVQKENPERLKETVRGKVANGFHVGVIAYREGTPVAWLSVGPLTDFYWAWRRVAQLGESSKSTAGILCFTIAEEHRGKNLQLEVLAELRKYAKQREWTSIEAYPFSDAAIEKNGPKLKWAGLTRGYEKSGFEKAGPHWLNHPDFERNIYTWAVR